MERKETIQHAQPKECSRLNYYGMFLTQSKTLDMSLKALVCLSGALIDLASNAIFAVYRQTQYLYILPHGTCGFSPYSYSVYLQNNWLGLDRIQMTSHHSRCGGVTTQLDSGSCLIGALLLGYRSADATVNGT